MIDRIKNKFQLLKKQNKKALGIFLTAGYPDINSSERILKNLPNVGVDFLEIGMPFSDPMADGPLIQESSEVAIKNGMNIEKCLNLVKKIRLKDNSIPIILMGYYNPIHLFGNKKFIKKAINSGVDGLIIVDLPVEEDKELFLESEKNNLHFIRLITPTTNLERVKKITKNANGFIYYVAVTGITGTKSALKRDVEKKIKQIKTITKLPIIIGFGIKNPDQAIEMSKLGNGIVIGSSLVEKIKKTKPFSKITNECINFVKKFATKF